MKKSKRLLALMLSIGIILNLLSGCSGAPAETEDTASNVTDSTAEDNASGSENNYNDPGMLPIVKETVELDVFMSTPSTVIVEGNEWVQWVEDETNIKMNIEAVPDGDAATKLNLIMNAQTDIPDVVNGGMGNAATVLAYAEQGLLVDFRDYWDRLVNLPEIAERDATNIALISSEDGSLYSSISSGAGYHVTYSQKYFMNQEWLNNLGLEVPTTTDELYDTLVAFKEQDANGNGDPNDEIPLVSSEKGWKTELIGFLMAPFSETGTRASHYLYEDAEAGDIKCGVYNEGFIEGMEYLNKLYSEGLIDQEAFTQEASAYNAIANAEGGNRGGSFTAGSVGDYAVASEEFPDTNYTPVAPLVGPDGVSRVQQFTPRANPIWQVTTSCPEEKIEAAVRLGDFFLADAFSDDPEEVQRSLTVFNGPNGYNYFEESDGLTSVSGEVGYYERTFQWADNTTLNYKNAHPVYTSYDIKRLMVAEEGVYNEEIVLWKATELYEQSADEFMEVNLPVRVSAENAAEYAELATQVRSYLDQHLAAFVTGSRDLAEWDDFLQELSDIGMTRYLEIANESYVAQ